MKTQTEIDPNFERRVVESLRTGGMIRRSRAPIYLAVAAALIAGFFAGRFQPSRAAAPSREFVLLLHETPQSANKGSAEEYVSWARSTGVIRPGGAKLTSETTVLGPGHTDGSLAGFFRITAKSREDAEAVAKTCPHLRHGGWIELREVERL